MKRETTLNTYTHELEVLITETLLPAYIDYCRILGRPNPTREINGKLLAAMKERKKIPALLQPKVI